MKEIEKLLQAGELSMDGFMGTDTRSLQDIVDGDSRVLRELGLDCVKVADRLRELSAAGEDILERPKLVEDRYEISVRGDRGPMPDPFGGPPLRKGDTLLKDHKTGKELRWNELAIAMIRQHGFFSGQGSHYRLDPRELAEVLGLA